MACSPGTPSPESEPNEADRAHNRAPTSIEEESPNEAATIKDYSGRKCFGHRPTILGTPGDDRFRATRADDVIITLGGNDVVIGPGRGAWHRICTGTGDDQVVYEGDHFYPDEIHVSLGPGDDRMTVNDPVRKVGIIVDGAGDDTILFARGSWAVVAPGPGDDQIRTPDARGLYSTTCIDLRRALGPVRINLARGRARGQGNDRFHNARCAFGGRFNDVLLGTPRNDRLDGGGGLDLVRAGAGDDDATGGYPTFSATGSNGVSDRADEVYLGPGNDWGEGDLGRDRMYGGRGRAPTWSLMAKVATTSKEAPATTTCTPAPSASACSGSAGGRFRSAVGQVRQTG